MARQSSRTATSNLTTYFMKIADCKLGETVKIKQQKKEGDKYVDLEDINQVEGKFHKAVIRKYQPRANEDAYELKLTLIDSLEGEAYVIGIPFNTVGRSIINRLLGLPKPIGTIKISVWNDRNSNYSKAAVSHNGEKTNWKFSLNEQKKFITETPVKEKGKTVIKKDYYELDMMLIKEVNEHLATSVTPDEMAGKPEDAKVESGSDDLPF